MSEEDERQLAEFYASGDPFEEIISTEGETPEDNHSNNMAKGE